MNKPTPSIDLTNACTMAIAAGTASDYSARSNSPEVSKAMEKLSLRFAELALQALGSEAGKGAGDEAASA